MGTHKPTGIGKGTQDCDGRDSSNRRNFIKTGVFSFMGLSLADLMTIDALAGSGACDSVILVWLAGGPSHIDTFDPKPGQETNGPFKPISTSVDGIQICEHMPTVARNMKLCSLIRSMTSKEGSHERATYEMHTGYKPLGSIKHPDLGSLIVNEKGRKNEEMPAYISIGRTAIGAGFLGNKAAPFYIGNPDRPTENIEYAEGVDYNRFKRRVDLLKRVDFEFQREKRDPIVSEWWNFNLDAARLMYSKSREAFDLSKEKEIYKKGYGDNRFGRSLLMARRLVEEGVRFVEVTLGGWDTHQNNFVSLEQNLATLDPALGTLIEDLNARGLLQRTMVICTGEFGRTPKINSANGRDHYPKVWSTLVAGGGIKQGYLYGSSDAKGENIKDKPCLPGQLHATMFKALGINYAKENYTSNGRPIRIVEKEDSLNELFA